MKNFLKLVLASLTAYLVGSLLFFLISLWIVSSLVSSATSKKTAKVEEQTILTLDLNSGVSERKVENPFASLGGDAKPLGLNQVLSAIKAAAEDENILGIYIKGGAPAAGFATCEEIRRALDNFKKSKKFVYAYSEVYTEKGLYIASVADKLYLCPAGMLEWNGIASNPMFVRGMLDKLEVEPMLFRVGDFKSAGETFIRKDMSEENRLQNKAILDDFWGQMTQTIATARKLDIAKLNALADSLTVVKAQDALAAKFVDELVYEDKLTDQFKALSKVEKYEDLHFMNIGKYAETKGTEYGKDNQVAVIYAVGDIVSGKGDENTIGSEGLSKALREAREDENIKAVVLRINSPGGSALASDVIAREVRLTKAVKPVIASFGDVAASGGYYIAADCDYIFALPSTVTGSIGVFGLLVNTQKMFENKLGITFDRVVTNTYADLGNLNRPMSEVEKNTIQKGVDRIYEEFLAVVKNGRKFEHRDSVHKIARGRVWTGNAAKGIKLIDQFGGIDDAVAYAAQKAGLGNDYTTTELPLYKSPFERFFEDMSSDGESQSSIGQAALASLGEEVYTLMRIRKLLTDPRGVYTHMFFDLNFN